MIISSILRRLLSGSLSIDYDRVSSAQVGLPGLFSQVRGI